jgi:segregation and condensation protein A
MDLIPEPPAKLAILAEPAPVAEPLPIIEPPAAPATASEPAPAPEPIVAPPIEAAVQIAAQSSEPVAVVEPAPAVEPVSVVPQVAELPVTPVIEPAPAPETVPSPAPTSQPVPDQKPVPKAPIKLETRDDAADLSPFSVVVEQIYDGPLDLLLDLIRKQDIDIYDIPIARITAQFLAYVNRLKASDVDVAGEFIYIASLLIHIKSKMLLPRAPSGPEEAAEDPRRELVERLLEHERFKNAAQMLQQKQMLEAATWTNPGFREFQDEAGAEPEIAADTVDLVRIFRDILERARNRPVIDLEEDSVTVGQMIQFLARRLTMEDKPVALRRLLQHTRSERALIAMFLALLELVRLQAILLRQDRAFSEIFIKKHTGFDALMNEGLSSARDDWR